MPRTSVHVNIEYYICTALLTVEIDFLWGSIRSHDCWYFGMTGLESSALFAATNPNLYVKYEEVFDASVSKLRKHRIYADCENCKVELKLGESASA
jgi:hypothetical protein